MGGSKAGGGGYYQSQPQQTDQSGLLAIMQQQAAAAAAAAAAQKKSQEDAAYNTAITNANTQAQKGTDTAKQQISASNQQQVTKDASVTSTTPYASSATTAIGGAFNPATAKGASLGNIGQAGGAGIASPKQVGAGASATAPVVNTTGASTNMFASPSVQGINLGGS